MYIKPMKIFISSTISPDCGLHLCPDFDIMKKI